MLLLNQLFFKSIRRLHNEFTFGEKSKQEEKKWGKILITTFVLIFLAVGAYAYSVYHSLSNAVDTMHQPLKREKSEKRTDDLSLKDAQPFSVLLLGVDQRKMTGAVLILL